MSVKKCDYEIIFGTPQTNYDKTYEYTRYNTKITFFVNENGSKIFFNRKKDSIEKFQTGTFFKEPIRRLYLINTLRYSKILSHQLCTVKIDNKEYQNIKNPITTIFPTENLSSVPSALANDKMITDLIEHFTLDNTKMTVLNNYLLALGYQNSPSEQFMHFWMAFNGMYGKLKREILRQKRLSTRTYVSENAELKNWRTCFDYDVPDCLFKSQNGWNEINKSNAHDIFKEIINLDEIQEISNVSQFNDSEIQHEISNLLVDKYEEITSISNSFGYLILRMAYYARCDLFHGSKKIHLFSVDTYSRNKVYSFLNVIFKDYLAKQFLDIFINNVLPDKVTSKLEQFI